MEFFSSLFTRAAGTHPSVWFEPRICGPSVKVGRFLSLTTCPRIPPLTENLYRSILSWRCWNLQIRV